MNNPIDFANTITSKINGVARGVKTLHLRENNLIDFANTITLSGVARGVKTLQLRVKVSIGLKKNNCGKLYFKYVSFRQSQS